MANPWVVTKNDNSLKFVTIKNGVSRLADRHHRFKGLRILVFAIIYLIGVKSSIGIVQAQSSINEKTGNWLSPTSWVGGIPPGTLTGAEISASLLPSITINGTITANASLSLNQITTFLVEAGDTLVVNGDLALELITIYQIDGVMTVLGDFEVTQSTLVNFGSTAQVVVTGDSEINNIVSQNAAIGSQIYIYGTNDGTHAITNPGTLTDLQTNNPALFNFVGGTSLPIELAHFNATRILDHVRIEWTTASEINNSHFNVERSRDGSNWQTIAKVSGAGNSNSPRKYEYVDQRPILGLSYYRLKQTDFDGKYERFETVSVDSAVEEITIYPNPVAQGGSIYVQGVDLEQSVEKPILYNAQGQIFEPQLSRLHNLVRIDLSTMDSGLYWIRKQGGRVIGKFLIK